VKKTKKTLLFWQGLLSLGTRHIERKEKKIYFLFFKFLFETSGRDLVSFALLRKKFPVLCYMW